MAQQLGIEYEIRPFLKKGRIPKIGKKIKNNLVIICRPNNPPGEVCPKEDILRVIRNLDSNSYLFLDEAYIDFCIEEELSFLIMDSRVLIGRTLSKAFGLAGLRIGFILGKEETLKKIKCFTSLSSSTSTINDLNLLIKEKYFENIKRYFPEIKKGKKIRKINI